VGGISLIKNIQILFYPKMLKNNDRKQDLGLPNFENSYKKNFSKKSRKIDFVVIFWRSSGR
jgi:hypothetical protein